MRRGDGSATKERTKYAVHDDGALREPQVAASSKPDGRSLRIMFGVANRTGGRGRVAARMSGFNVRGRGVVRDCALRGEIG